MKITVRPDIIDKAKENGLPVRAFWLWHYAKHICKAGGTIPEQALKDSLKAIGISKTSRCNWLNDAVKIGLFTLVVSNRTGLIYYKLASWGEGGFIAGLSWDDERIGKSITVELDIFISGSWKPEVWGGRLLQLRGRDEKLIKITRDKRHPEAGAIAKVIERKAKPISRNTITELTGVSRSTQQRREKRAGVAQVENYLIGQDGLGYQPYGHDKEYPGHHVHFGEERLRLPNSRIIPDRIKLSNSQGSTRRANKRLKALCKSDAIAEGEKFPRMYADNFEHAIALHQDSVMYLTGKLLQSDPDEPIKRAWRRLQHES